MVSSSINKEENDKTELPVSKTINDKPLDLVIIQNFWNELTEEKKIQNKINDYIILNNRKLELDGNTIKFGVENAFQVDYLNIFRTEIIEFLRAKTDSSILNLEYWIEKKVENERKAYTPSEKYQYLLAKFPTLGELRTKLGLDLEY